MIDPLMVAGEATLRARIHERWPRLADGDIDAFGAGRDALIELVRSAYDASRSDAEREVDEFFDVLSGIAPRAPGEGRGMTRSSGSGHAGFRPVGKSMGERSTR